MTLNTPSSSWDNLLRVTSKTAHFVQLAGGSHNLCFLIYVKINNLTWVYVLLTLCHTRTVCLLQTSTGGSVPINIPFPQSGFSSFSYLWTLSLPFKVADDYNNDETYGKSKLVLTELEAGVVLHLNIFLTSSLDFTLLESTSCWASHLYSFYTLSKYYGVYLTIFLTKNVSQLYLIIRDNVSFQWFFVIFRLSCDFFCYQK